MDQKFFMINELEFERMMKEAAKIGATTAIEKLGEEKAKQVIKPPLARAAGM